MDSKIEILKQEAESALQIYVDMKEKLEEALQKNASDNYIEYLKQELTYFDGRRSAFNTALEILVGRQQP